MFIFLNLDRIHVIRRKLYPILVPLTQYIYGLSGGWISKLRAMARYRRLKKKKKKLKKAILFIALLGLIISFWFAMLGDEGQEEADSYKQFWGEQR